MWAGRAILLGVAMTTVCPTEIAIGKDVIKKTAVLGDSVDFECDATSPQPDNLLIILWHKDESLLYSYDLRNTAESERAWINTSLISSDRVDFDMRSKPMKLRVSRLQSQDGGQYRCRADFHRSRTKYSKFQLKVIVPPVLAISANGSPINGTMAGPFELGDSLTLYCRAVSGDPKPRVWWKSQTQRNFDKSSEFASDHLLSEKSSEIGASGSALIVSYLSRTHTDQVFTCLATNTNLTEPVQSKVRLDMKLSPLSVAILEKRNHLLAGQRTRIQCRCLGSRPTAVITWLLGPGSLPGSPAKTVTMGNVTMSSVDFVPRPIDDNQPIYCRCVNDQLDGPTLEDTWRIRVRYSPQVHVRMAASLKPENIKQGDDAYFECQTKANPPVETITWFHNEEQLVQNIRRGVIITNDSLVLQKLPLAMSGTYSCLATNSIGATKSLPALLDIKYAPRCAANMKHVYGAAKREVIHIACHVQANPSDVRFSWTFNNSAESLQIAEDDSRLTRNGTISTLEYRPRWQTDYGTLACRASNRVGHAREACMFHIVAAGLPDPLTNCSLTASRISAVTMTCDKGFDGGTMQTFTLKVKSIDEDQVVHTEERSDRPVWEVTGLIPGHRYTLSATAVNIKGAAPSVVLFHRCVNSSVDTGVAKPDKSEASMVEVLSQPTSLSPLAAILSGVCAAVAVLLIVTAIVARTLCHNRRRRAAARHSSMESCQTPGNPADSAVKCQVHGSCDRLTEHRQKGDLPSIYSAVDDAGISFQDVCPASLNHTSIYSHIPSDRHITAQTVQHLYRPEATPKCALHPTGPTPPSGNSMDDTSTAASVYGSTSAANLGSLPRTAKKRPTANRQHHQ